MQMLKVAVGLSRQAKYWKNTTITWEELIERLQTATRTPETQGEYRNMTKAQQDAIKDVGGFVGGSVKGGRRKADCLDSRYIITLDADYASCDFAETLQLFFDYAYCIYSTHKHTPEKPRLRLLMPLSRPCSGDEYEAVARLLAQDIGIDMFDDTTYQAHRLMYWPSASIDGEYFFRTGNQKPVDVDQVLARYDDWRDVSSWPVSTRTVKAKDKLLKKQEDPTTKKGIVGVFCRAFDIDAAIDKFLPEVYIKCGADNRYTYAEGSSAAGLVVYENGKFAYSNHATDPIGGQLCNAFDLVRIHKFGSQDDAAADGTPTVKLPSYLAMQELASKDEEVKLLAHRERLMQAKDDFSGLTGDSADVGSGEDEAKWVLQLAVDGKGRYTSTIDNVKKILMSDPALKGKIAFNAFTQKHRIMGAAPWDSGAEERDWTDADDAGLRHYLENVYDIKGKPNISDAWILVSKENQFHPVKEYLTRLVWDGRPRLDRVFIDYLGAEANSYTQMVTRKALTAAVARIFVPGIKYDTMPVLVGPQGCGKSQIIKRLGQEWFSDTLTTVKGKEAYEQIQGFWIIEVAELAAMKRAETEAVKHFIAKGEDVYRVAYGHHVESFKRQCVFIGTTNTYEFLKDMTGNRRFWPIDVNPDKAAKNMWTDLDEIEVNQIWAEAVEVFKRGEKIFIDDNKLKELAEAEQNRHLEDNPLAGEIEQYLEKLLPEEWETLDLSGRRDFYEGNHFGKVYKGTKIRERVCALEIWCELLYGDKKDLTIAKSKEIRDIILKTGQWEQMKTNSRFGNLYGRQRGFIRKSKL